MVRSGNGIHDKIVKLPGGYYAPVDQNACGFDGEESRRLTLARLFLQNSGIIICDGAITALNTETGQDLQMALKDGFRRQAIDCLRHKLRMHCIISRTVRINGRNSIRPGPILVRLRKPRKG